jgi:iron complex transport system permease protein
MFSSFAGAIVSVLTYFGTAEQLQNSLWSLGSIGIYPGTILFSYQMPF